VNVKRIGISLIALFVLAGCGGHEPPAAAPPATQGSQPTAAATPSADAVTPSPTASSAAEGPVEFTVDGAGPYQLGAELAALKETPGLSEVTTGGASCPQNTTARGTGAWQDVHLSFRQDGTLYLATNRSTSIPTPSGAWLGSTLAQLKSIYKGITGEDLARGAKKAYLVTTASGRGILFELDAGARVGTMMAGEGEYLRSSFQRGQGFC
jgi:hypothetical protein